MKSAFQIGVAKLSIFYIVSSLELKRNGFDKFFIPNTLQLEIEKLSL
jgi:hypothetical protein